MRKNLTICLMCVCLAAAAGCKKGAEPPTAEPVRQTITMEQPAPAAEQAATEETPAAAAPAAPDAEAAPEPEPDEPAARQPDDVTEMADVTDMEPEVAPGAETEGGTTADTSGEVVEGMDDETAAAPEIVINLMELEPADDQDAAEAAAARDEAMAMFSPFTPLFQKDSNEEDMFIERDSPRQRAFLTPLERISLGQLKLSGIIRAATGNRAIVTDATGKGYVVKKGTYIGMNSGQVESIVDDRVIVVEEIGGRRAITELKLQKPAGE